MEEDGASVTSEKHQPTDIFKNNHDLIGVEGIIEEQKHEIDKKKVSLYFLCSTAGIEN